MSKVLVLYSGGKDSMLSTMLLVEKGYEVYLVHYDNSLEIGCSNVKSGVNRLKKKYNDRIHYIGIKKTDGIFREFIKEFYNMDFNEIISKYGSITVSQFNCLACRVSMYVLSIILCKKLNIEFVADGARNSQLFAIEQDEIIELFKNLFKKYNIELLLPVKDLEDDYHEKNELLVRGFVPKVYESQCLIGMPLESSVSDLVISGVKNIYNDLIFPKIDFLILSYKDSFIGEEYI